MKTCNFRLSKIFIKLFSAVVFSTIISAILLISCKGVDNSLIETEEEKSTVTSDSSLVAQDYVTLSISADFPTYGRTINPNDIIFSTDMALSFMLYGEWKGEGDEDTDVTFEKTWTASTAEDEQKTAYQIMCADNFQILKGTWDFTLSAFKNGKEMYYQTLKNKTLNARENDSNAITLDFGIMKEAEEGNGSVTVTLDFPADKGIVSVKAGLIKLDGTELNGFVYENLEIKDSETAANTKTVEYKKSSVPGGTYRIKFALYDSNAFLAKTSRDIIHIAPCNESTGSLTVTEINTLYKITYVGISEEYNCVTDYSVQDDYELVESYNASQTIVLPVKQLQKGAYYPGAWYESEDFSGEPITGWEIGDRAEAVTVYPKWYTTGSDAATAISALTKAGDYTIRIKGSITSDNFTSINTALKGLSSSLEIGVTLDLSEATMTTIPANAFNGCTKLKGIIIPGCVTSIGNFAFNGCTGLKTLRLEDGTTTLTLGYNTYSISTTVTTKGLFYDCLLESIYVGRNLKYKNYSDSSTYSGHPEYYGYSAFANITKSGLEVEIGANVTSIPMYMFYGCTGMNEVTVSSSAQITGIKKYAFYNCKALESFTIPGTVTTIDTYAFAKSGITSLTVPGNVTSIDTYVFEDCTKLASISIAGSVTNIGNYAFNGCTGLKTLRLEDGTTTLTLGYNTYSISTTVTTKGLFCDCPLESIYVGRNLKYKNYSDSSTYSGHPEYYGYSAFANITKSGLEVEIGANVTSIPMYMFYGCTGLSSVVINDSAVITSIGLNAFSGCNALSSLKKTSATIPQATTDYKIIIPTEIKTIEEGAFQNCTKLASISISGSVTNIRNYAFNGCTGLKTLRLEDGTTNLTLGYNSFSNSNTGIKKGLFRDCPLESLYVGRNLTYANYSSSYTYSTYPEYYGYSAFANIASSLEEIPELNVEIGSKVTSIPMYMFYGCKGLSSVVINDSAVITSIGLNAFSGCNALSSLQKTSATIPQATTDYKIIIPTEIKTIEQGAFQNCTKLASISISGSVTNIGNYAFNGCTGLKTLRLEDGTTNLTLGYNTYTSSGTGKGLFYDCPLESVYVGRNLTYANYSSSYTYSTYPEYYGYSAFAQNKSSFEAEIGANLTSIAIYMFYGCTGLSKVTVSSSAQISTIKSNAFYNCTALKSFTIPETVKVIETNVFQKSGITSLTIPKSVISIGSGAFNGCTGLKTLRLENGGVTLSLGYNNYYSGSNAKGLFRDCPLEELYLGRALTYINNSSGYSYTEKPQNYGYSAFAYITTLANVEISVPEGLSSYTIGKYAFSGCGITSATITPATGWKRSSNSSSSTGTSIEEDLSDESVAASCLVDSADGYYLHWVAPQQ